MPGYILALVFCAFALAAGAAHAETPWEKYVAEPSPRNAHSVSAIQYSAPPSEPTPGETITADIQMLAVQVYSGDRDAFRLTLRLMDSTPPGANLEDLYEIAGRFLRQNPKAFLEGIAAAGDAKRCPGANFVGVHYADLERARAYELRARRKALLAVKTKNLLSVRNSCLAQLRHDR